MDELEIQELLENTALEFNESFEQQEYPDVQLGKFMTITQKGNIKTTEKGYGEQSGTQDLDNGLIDENTTSLETEDVNVKAKKMGYIDWGKSVIYTKLAVERAANYGIQLDKSKMENLRGVALRTMQKTALAGHAVRTDVTGLLNNASVNVEDLTKGKPISEMSGAEARQFFLNLIKYGYQASDEIIMPNTVAIDSMDLLTLSGLYDSTITNGDSTINTLTAIKEALREFAQQDISILGIPMSFAKGAGKNKSNRACVYTNNEETIYTDWARAPSAGAVFQRSPTSFEIPVESQFTGAIISKLDRFIYVDYKS